MIDENNKNCGRNDGDLSELALDRLLSSATRPQVPAGALARLQDRVAGEATRQPDVVVPFRRRFFGSLQGQSPLPAAAALAASLLIGIYAGTTEIAGDWIPGAIAGASGVETASLFDRLDFGQFIDTLSEEG